MGGEHGAAPIAFVSIDLDYYSSTMQAFEILKAGQARLLPRGHFYFDDIMGFTFSEYNGERLAIAEFNRMTAMRKISPIYGLKHFLPRQHAQALWAQEFYMAHIFDHELYEAADEVCALNDNVAHRAIVLIAHAGTAFVVQQVERDVFAFRRGMDADGDRH